MLKKLTWQQWTSIGVIVAFAVIFIILHLVQPSISFAFAELFAIGTFVGGFASGYLFSKRIKIEDKNIKNKEILND